jgi:vacuolar protein-sorting-associated protein 4
MFKIRLGKTPHAITEDDFLELGKATEGYSGSDISTIVKEAMMMPVRRCQTARKFI